MKTMKAIDVEENSIAIIRVPDPEGGSPTCDTPTVARRRESFTDQDGNVWVGWATVWPFATHWTFPGTEVRVVAA